MQTGSPVRILGSKSSRHFMVRALTRSRSLGHCEGHNGNISPSAIRGPDLFSSHPQSYTSTQPTLTPSLCKMRMLPATPSDAASPRAHSFGNRLLSHTELSRDEETTRSPHGVHAHKLYIPPHMRTHSEDMASITGSDPTANGTPTIGPGHGPGPDCEDKRAPSFQAPCTDPFTAFPHIAPLLEDIMRRVDEQKELLGWVAREVELLKGDFLKLGRVQKLRSAGPTGEAQERVNYHINHSHGPSSTRPLDVNVSVCSGVFVRKETHCELDRPLGWNLHPSTPAQKKDVHNRPNETCSRTHMCSEVLDTHRLPARKRTRPECTGIPSLSLLLRAIRNPIPSSARKRGNRINDRSPLWLIRCPPTYTRRLP